MIQRVIITLIFGQSIWSFGFVRDYQTTRMISTSGAGTASILMVDALALNPATSAFFTDSLIYLQQNSGEVDPINSGRPASSPYNTEPSGLMFAITDGTTKTKGGGSYQKYEDNDTERTRYSFNMATQLSRSTSLGGTYHFTKDKNSVLGQEDDFHRIDLGLLTFLNGDFSYGFSLKDLGGSEDRKSTFTSGVQYVASKNVVLIGDIGFDYTRSFSGSFFYRVSAQVEFLSDLSFRVGLFDDKNTNLKGGSYGILWNGPKLSLEGAIKKSRMRDNLSGYLYKDERLTDISLSAIVKI